MLLLLNRAAPPPRHASVLTFLLVVLSCFSHLRRRVAIDNSVWLKRFTSDRERKLTFSGYALQPLDRT